MRQRIMIALCIAAGGAAIAYAQAQPASRDAHAGMGGLDHGIRSAMTRTDAEKRVSEHFAMLDLNHDGVVTRDEIAAVERTERDKMHAFMEARMKEHREHEFDRLDANHDGSISRAEFAAAGPPMPPHGPESADAPPPPPGGPGEGHRMAMGGPGGPGRMLMMMHGPMMSEHWFERADANHDDKVTLAEAKAVALARFDRLDTNHDGTIEPEERRMAFRGSWHGHRGAPMPPPPGAMPPSQS